MAMELGRLVTEFRELDRRMSEAAMDARAFHAPSECHGLIGASQDRELERWAKRNGFASVERFLAAVAQRTSARWVFCNL